MAIIKNANANAENDVVIIVKSVNQFVMQESIPKEIT